MVWDNAIAQRDKDGDGKLDFDEAVTMVQYSRLRRNQELQERSLDEVNACDDCDTPDYCNNMVLNMFDNHCRNTIKTTPLEDEELLRLLATAANDIYCGENIEQYTSYVNCPVKKRAGMGEWLDRGPVKLVSI